MAAPDDMMIDPKEMDEQNWTTVTQKKDVQAKNPESVESTMKKIRLTWTIRAPKDTSAFSPAKLHIDTLHEIHKFDESLIVFNATGESKINIETPMSEAKYKEQFKPVEKRTGRGPSSSISISHDIYISEEASECKAAIFPYLKKNKIFIYFNPKPGLEHFSAIGVLFGPNPDYTWRDELADLLVETMKAEIDDHEKQKFKQSSDGQQKIILSLNIQTIGIRQPTETTSVALEIRVPTGQERLYTGIIKRLYEKAEMEEIVIPTKLGKFFPYYLKSKMPKVFNFLMHQQNADMASTAVIPIFGYTPEARKQTIKLDGEETTVELALATMENIIRIEATPSTWNLFKYLAIVKTNDKEKVHKTIQNFFGKITNDLENQPPDFPRPRCGGRKTSKDETPKMDATQMAYMMGLETLAQAQNPQDAGPAEPPKRYRKITISYAGAVKSGILKPMTPSQAINMDTDENRTQATANTQYSMATLTQRQVSWDDSITATSRSMNSSLSRSMTNSKISILKKDYEQELCALNERMEKRLEQQDKKLEETKNSINSMNEDMEIRMAQVVILAMVKEKAKVEELTHGRVYDKSLAPLADENGRLPGGAIAQSSGPLHRLHHVEVTVQHMSAVLDTIAEHLYANPESKHLFKKED
jgi:hypothetical protein